MGEGVDPQPASEAYAALEESLTIRPRAYQWEVFEAAREGNVCTRDTARNLTPKPFHKSNVVPVLYNKWKVARMAISKFKYFAGHCLPGHR